MRPSTAFAESLRPVCREAAAIAAERFGGWGGWRRHGWFAVHDFREAMARDYDSPPLNFTADGLRGLLLSLSYIEAKGSDWFAYRPS